MIEKNHTMIFDITAMIQYELWWMSQPFIIGFIVTSDVSYWSHEPQGDKKKATFA